MSLIKSLEEKAEQASSEKINTEWIQAATIISFLYDVAGRSEDAQSLTWDCIKKVDGKPAAKLK